MSNNTIYIAEPFFSERLQKFDNETSFPPIKKIGITTGLPDRRERELMGTTSPVKISIVKAWTEVDARKIESMLHSILDNSRLDGEYFWDVNETLVEAVSAFIQRYHPEAKLIEIAEEADVAAATEAAQNQNSQRLVLDVIPQLEALSIKLQITKSGRSVRFKLGEYNLLLSGRTSGRYTLTIWSKTKSTEDALSHFEYAQELAGNSSEDSTRKARIPMSSVKVIIESISKYVKQHGV